MKNTTRKPDDERIGATDATTRTLKKPLWSLGCRYFVMDLMEEVLGSDTYITISFLVVKPSLDKNLLTF